MTRASLLPVGTGYFDLTAGVVKTWESGGLNSYVRAELGVHPTKSLAAFAFAEADLQRIQAGIGARVIFP